MAEAPVSPREVKRCQREMKLLGRAAVIIAERNDRSKGKINRDDKWCDFQCCSAGILKAAASLTVPT